jgi:hypothetical protein
MKLTDKTYQVYTTTDTYTNVAGRGSKREMQALFDACKNNTEYTLVALMKYSVRYNCWYSVEKRYNDQ